MKDADQARLVQENRFARILGKRFLQFVCAASEDQIEARLADGRRLPSNQEDVLAHVLSIAAQSAVIAFQTGGDEGSFLYPLFEYDQNERTSHPNVLRRAAGGDFSRIRHRTPAERTLSELARDVYPALLVKSQLSGLPLLYPRWLDKTSALSPLVFRHPAGAAFEESVESDPLLARLFTHERHDSGKSGFVWTSLGMGRGIQLSMLAQQLLSNAALEVTLNNTEDQATFIAAALNQLTLLRRLLQGEQVHVKCVLAFVGAQLMGKPLRTPWGVLRNPTPGELDLRAESPVAYSQELVLETEMPFEIKVEDPETQFSEDLLLISPLADVAQETFAELQRRADRIALTLLLGIEREPPVAIARTWTLVEDPLNLAPSLSWTQNVVPLHPHTLAYPDRRRVRVWMERINHHYTDRVEIAVKRTLASLTSRWDATDRLIDAVVALENLFGTGSGELTFRISAGCAWLLEREPDRRLELQRRVSQLYELRSRIVHGSHAAAPNDLFPEAEAAALLAVRSLRELFGRRQNLLDRKDRARLLTLQIR